MTVRVEVEGHPTLEFPDGTDPAVIDATVKKVVSGGIQKADAWDRTKRDLDVVQHAAARGAVGMFPPVMAGNLADFGQWMASNLPGMDVPPPTGEGFFPRTKDAMNWLSRQGINIPGGDPQGPKEKLLAGTTEMATNFGLNPLGVLSKAPSAAKTFSKAGAISGGVGGATAETLKNFTPSDQAIAELLGAAIPMVTTAYRGARTPNTVKVVQSYAGDVGPTKMRAAEARRASTTETTGVPTILTQGLDQQTALDDIVRQLMNAPEGAAIREVLQKQQAATDPLVRSVMDRIGTNMEGTQADANRVLKAGQTIVQRKKDARSQLTEPHYTAAKDDFVQNPVTIIKDIRRGRQEQNIPRYLPEGKKMANLEDSLLSSVLADFFGTGRGLRTMELDTVSKLAREEAGKAFDAGQNTRGYSRKIVADAIDKATLAASGNLREGRRVHKAASEALVDPLETGPFASFFDKGTLQGKKGDFDKWVAAFDSSKPEDVAQVAAYFKNVDPEAFAAIVKESWTRKAEAALKTTEGRQSTDSFNSFYNSVMGGAGSETRDRFTTAIGQIAQMRGQDPRAAVAGANKLADAFATLARNPGKEAARDFPELSKEGFFSGIMKFFGQYTPIRAGGRKLASMRGEETYLTLVDAMTSPDGLKKLEEIARFAKWPHRVKAFTSTGLRSAAALGPESAE